MENNQPELGKHSFDGACAPDGREGKWRFETFSVGIFQWVAKSGGNGVKRGPVKVRVKGLTDTTPKRFSKRSARSRRRLTLGRGRTPAQKIVTVEGAK